MSEVDRLSNSGLYPALPMAEKRSSGGGGDKQSRPRATPGATRDKPESERDSATGKDQKTTIDEYA